MSRRPRSRWFAAAVGCFSLVLITVGGVGVALLWAGYSYRSLGEPAATAAAGAITRQRDGATPTGGPDGAVPETAALSEQEFPGASRALSVKLLVRLSEGHFEVLPGPPGSDITVEGTFAANYYDLVEDRRDGPDGGEVEIRLEPSAGWFTRIMAGLNNINSRHPNRLKVRIPPDVAVDLELLLDSAESEVELGGLLLTGLRVDLTKGSFRLGIQEPLTGELQQASLRLGMGDGRISRLGNARAAHIELDTGMGGFQVDLDGAWRPGETSEIEVSHKMGDLTLTVPSTVRLARDSSSAAIMGGINGRLNPDDFAPEDDLSAPMLRVDTTASMGGVNLRRRR